MNVAQAIASRIQAMANCEKSGNDEWFKRHEQEAVSIAKDCLPSGSGVDCGTTIAFDDCKADKLVFSMEFHHMDEMGGYDGWTSHIVTVRPAFSGFDIRVSGINRNYIKDYLAELMNDALSAEYVTPNK